MAQVHVRRSEVDFVLDLGNISCSGVLVLLGSLESPVWMEIGRQVELGIFGIEGVDNLTVRGAIARIHRGGDGVGFAVHFDRNDDETQQAVQRLIELAIVSDVHVPRP